MIVNFDETGTGTSIPRAMRSARSSSSSIRSRLSASVLVFCRSRDIRDPRKGAGMKKLLAEPASRCMRLISIGNRPWICCARNALSAQARRSRYGHCGLQINFPVYFAATGVLEPQHRLLTGIWPPHLSPGRPCVQSDAATCCAICRGQSRHSCAPSPDVPAIRWLKIPKVQPAPER